MNRCFIPLFVALSAFIGGCHLAGDTGIGVGKLDDGSGGSGSDEGITNSSCSPFDTAGWDFSIGLDANTCDATAPTHDWIRISLWQEEEIPPSTGSTYSFGMADGFGEAVLYPEGDLTKAVVAALVELRITSANSGEIRGEYELTFDESTVITGTFITTVCEAVDCG